MTDRILIAISAPMFAFAIGVLIWINFFVPTNEEILNAPLETKYSQESFNKQIDDLFAQLVMVKEEGFTYLACPATGSSMSAWSGGTELPYNDLYKTVEELVNAFPYEIKDKKGFISLIIETAATESFFGKEITQRRGPALGVFQMEPATYTCIQDNYLKYNNSIRLYILGYKDRSLSNIDNLKTNIPYQTAYAITLYARYGAHEIEDLSSINVRAQIYKQIWNTYKGSGSVEKFLADASDKLNTYYTRD